MPNGTQFDEFDDDNEELDGSDLIKQLRKQVRDLGRENGTLKERVTVLSGKDRQRTLSESLTAKGLNPKAAKFYPADAELTDEAVTAWISENADVLGPAVPVATDETLTPSDPGEGQAPVEQSSDQTSVVDPANEIAFRRMQAANLVGSVGSTREQEFLRSVDQAKSPEELTAFLRSARA